GENRVEVGARGLGVRNHARRTDPAPARDLGAYSLAGALLAEVGAPGPGGDDDVDIALRVEPQFAVTAERDRPDVGRFDPIAAQQVMGGGADVLGRVGHRQVVELGRSRQPGEVVGVAEDGRAAGGLVAPDALENAGSVVQSVREDVDLGVLPGDEFAVLPNQL